MALLRDFDWKDKRLVIPFAVAVALAGISLGVEFLPGLLSPAPPAEPEPAWPARSPLPAPAPAAPATPAVERSASADAPLTMEQFMGLLARETPAPVARKVAAGFLRDPALRKTWTDYHGRRGARAPAREFFQALARLPEFRRLMSQFRDDPGFQRAFLHLAAIPAVSDVLRSAAGGAAGPSASASRAFYSRTRGARGAAVAAGGAAGTAGGTQAFGAGSAPGAIGGAGARSFESRAEAGADPDAQDDARRIGKDLAKIKDLKDSVEAQRTLDSLFASMPKEARDKLMAVCLTQGICDPIDACVAAGVAEECAAACARTGRCSFEGAPSRSDASTICAPVCADRMDESCRECRRNPDAYAANACATFCEDPLDESCRACRRDPARYGR